MKNTVILVDFKLSFNVIYCTNCTFAIMNGFNFLLYSKGTATVRQEAHTCTLILPSSKVTAVNVVYKNVFSGIP
jgi:hypothetical protein